ncbi:hypothetical protein [Pelagivirga sediminicola]|nr:hypothetical protein [Pelagivirga sediminicola]
MSYPNNISLTPPDVSAHLDEAANTISDIVKDPADDHCARPGARPDHQG